MGKIHTYIRTTMVSGLVLLISSCSNTKYLNEGEMLFTGAEVKIESDLSLIHI